MKYPEEKKIYDAVNALIQLVIFVLALIHHDWFLLAACWVLNTNKRRVINYEGE